MSNYIKSALMIASVFTIGVITAYNCQYSNSKKTVKRAVILLDDYQMHYSDVHNTHTSLIRTYRLYLLNCQTDTIFIIKYFDFQIEIILDEVHIREICKQIDNGELLLNICHSNYFYEEDYAQPLSPIIYFTATDNNGMHTHFKLTKPFYIITPLYCTFSRFAPNWLICNQLSTAVAVGAFWDYIKKDPIDYTSCGDNQPLWSVKKTSEMAFILSGKYMYTKIPICDSSSPTHFIAAAKEQKNPFYL